MNARETYKRVMEIFPEAQIEALDGDKQIIIYTNMRESEQRDPKTNIPLFLEPMPDEGE